MGGKPARGRQQSPTRREIQREHLWWPVSTVLLLYIHQQCPAVLFYTTHSSRINTVSLVPCLPVYPLPAHQLVVAKSFRIRTIPFLFSFYSFFFNFSLLINFSGSYISSLFIDNGQLDKKWMERRNEGRDQLEDQPAAGNPGWTWTEAPAGSGKITTASPTFRICMFSFKY